jgi:uncharacterized membrane protein YeiB
VFLTRQAVQSENRFWVPVHLPFCSTQGPRSPNDIYDPGVSNREIATRQRLHVGKLWFSAEALYIGAITALAVLGMSSWSDRPILLIATLLSLPCGFVALFGLYALTGLFSSIANGFSNEQSSYGGCSETLHGVTRCWSAGTPVGAQGFWFSFSVVALFTIAALANVLTLRLVLRRRRSRRESYGGPRSSYLPPGS